MERTFSPTILIAMLVSFCGHSSMQVGPGYFQNMGHSSYIRSDIHTCRVLQTLRPHGLQGQTFTRWFLCQFHNSRIPILFGFSNHRCSTPLDFPIQSIPSTSTLLNGGTCSPRTPLQEVLASQMEQVTIAQQIGQFPCPMIISNHSVNGGSNASSSPNFTTDSWKRPKFIQLNHLSPKRNSPRFFKTSETPSHQSQSMSPFCRINPSDFIFFTLSCYSPRTLTRILLSFFNKGYPQVLFLRSNQQVFGHPIPNHLMTSLIFKFVKIIGAVRTKTLQPRLCSYKMRLTMDSSRRSQIYNPLKLVGLLVLLLENSVWSTLTTDVLDSTICGMNGRCLIPEKQRLPNMRHISWFLSSCPPLQDEWQGASIDIKAAHKRMLIREDERGSLLFRFQGRLYAYRSAHFGAKTSAWHWGRVSRPSCDCYTGSSISAMLPGSMSMTSSFSSHAPPLLSSSHYPSFFSR